MPSYRDKQTVHLHPEPLHPATALGSGKDTSGDMSVALQPRDASPRLLAASDATDTPRDALHVPVGSHAAVAAVSAVASPPKHVGAAADNASGSTNDPPPPPSTAVARSPSMPTVEEGRVMSQSKQQEELQPAGHARMSSPLLDDHDDNSPGEKKCNDDSDALETQRSMGSTAAGLQTSTQFKLSLVDIPQIDDGSNCDGIAAQTSFSSQASELALAPLIEGTDQYESAEGNNGRDQTRQGTNDQVGLEQAASAGATFDSPATVGTNTAATGTSVGAAPNLPATDRPSSGGHVSNQIGCSGNPYDRPYHSSRTQAISGRPPYVAYSDRQMMPAVSPLHAPVESTRDNLIPDIPLIQNAQASHDAATHSSANSISTPPSSFGSSMQSSLMSSVATPPAYDLAGGSGGGSGSKYYYGQNQQHYRSSAKPQVYSAIGSLESLTSPSSLSAKILASQQQYQRVPTGPMIPPPNTRAPMASSTPWNKSSQGGASSRGIVIGPTVKNGNSSARGASGRPSLLSQVEKGGLSRQPQEEDKKQGRDKRVSLSANPEDVAKQSEKVEKVGRSTSQVKLKSSLRRHSSTEGGDAASSLRKEKKKKKKTKKKSVKIDTKSTKVIPAKPAEMFRPSCDAYTPRMGRKKIEYKPAEHRTPVQKMSGPMGTISRPNFRDALRRVAMIIQQHVVKIEQRFESGVHEAEDSGLFRHSMREAFTEDNFVTPRYKCTVLRLPMGRPGVIYGHRKIKVEYKVPTVEEIYDFGHQLFKAVQLSSECSIVCLIYVERLMETAKVPLLADTWKPIFMAGLLLASKVWQDLSSWNIEFASVYPQFSLEAINRLELQFLKNVKWDLYISSSLYAKYYFALRSLLEKQNFRQRYNRMTGVGGVTASEAMKVQKRTERVKEEALVQLSRSM